MLERVLWGASADEVLAHWTSANGWQYFHQDPLNSPVAVTNASGAVLEKYLYDAYGLDLIYDASGNVRSVSALNNPWRFTGQEWIEGLNLHNYKNRFYSDDLGRFLQQDPIRFDAGDMNLYRYCGNDPIDKNDPEGLYNIWGHNSLFNSALGDTVSKTDLGFMKAGSALEDKETGSGTTENEVAQHAMSFKGQDKNVAARNTEAAIDKKVDDAVDQELKGDHAAAMKIFGRAAHTVQDGVSPAHRGSKVWEGLKGPLKVVKAAVHAVREIWPSKQARAKSDKETKALYEKFTKKVEERRKLPKK